MGYRAEKEKVEKKLRIIRLIALAILLTAIIGLCVFSAFRPPKTWKYYVDKPKIEQRGKGDLRIHFLDVGQGDATLIELPDGKVAMIDGGPPGEKVEKYVMRYLNALKIDVIDYLIVTHSDRDHCGSLKAVLERKKVLNTYLPIENVESTGETYTAFYQQLLLEAEDKDCSYQFASRKEMLGVLEGEYPYTFSILYPAEDAIYGVGGTDDSSNNDESAVVWLDYMGMSALFMGDAPCSTEQRLIFDYEMGFMKNHGVTLESTEILKVSHHGSAKSTSLEFLEYLHLQAAVVSCGKNNSYGHPSEEVQERLKLVGAALYRTDQDGTVMVTVKSDGNCVINR